MNNALITILITHYNNIDFIENSLYAIYKLTNNNFKIIINDNGSDNTNLLRLSHVISNYNNNGEIQVNFRITNSGGSMAHGEALDIMMNLVDTKYTVILDADCTPLIKNWDELLMSKLNDTVKIVGTQLSDDTTGGLKYSDFPYQFLLFFDTETFRKLNISFKPGDISSGQDTAWELRDKYNNNGYSSDVLIMKNTRKYKEGPFKDFVCAEFYMEGINEIFCSHYGRSTNMKSKGIFKTKYNLLNRFLCTFDLIAGEKIKQKWIAKCKDIVDNNYNIGK